MHKTRIGQALASEDRLIVIEAEGGRIGEIALDDQVKAVISANFGTIQNAVVQPNPQTGGWRVSFQLAPDGNEVIELRAQLKRGDDALSEVWVYRWTP